MYNKIVQSTSHREYPLPKGPWVMMQKWVDLLFLHWPVPKNVMEDLIPPELELDTYDKDAWITIIPFKVSRMRLRNMPQIPYFRSYLELNVRTYVKRNGMKGVYFFSLDASKVHAVLGARMATLPYFYANMDMRKNGDTFRFNSRRIGEESAVFNASYRPVGEPFTPQKDSLNDWLLERYYLWTYKFGSLFRVGIHHGRWEMQQAEAVIENQLVTPFIPASVLEKQPIKQYASSKIALFWMVRKEV